MEYKLELIVKEPMGSKGEITFTGSTEDPLIAFSVNLLLTATEYRGFANEIKLYRDGSLITEEDLYQDFKDRYLDQYNNYL